MPKHITNNTIFGEAYSLICRAVASRCSTLNEASELLGINVNTLRKLLRKTTTTERSRTFPPRSTPAPPTRKELVQFLHKVLTLATTNEEQRTTNAP